MSIIPRLLQRRALAGVVAGVLAAPCVQAESDAIDLARPVSDSLTNISGIYWNFDTDMGLQPQVQDLSGNGYHGLPMPGNGELPTLTGGVDRPGTSGYGKALELLPGEHKGEGNPRVIVNLPPRNRLALAGVSFTGGLWLKLRPGNAPGTPLLLMDKGGFNTRGGEEAGHFCLYLVKARGGAWQIAFQMGDGLENANILSAPLAGTIEDGQWHHVGFNFIIGDNGSNRVAFWLNGERLGEATVAVGLNSGDASTTSRRFSLAERAVTRYASRVNGAVDDLFLTEGIYPFKPVKTP